MRALAIVMLIAGLLSSPLRAQDAPVSASDQAAIRSVITNQLDAFRRDDGPGAFSFAAPNIKTLFGSADTFLEMVRRAYQPVYRPRSVDFTTLSQEDDGIVQSVELIGPDGLAYTARYTMERQADGTWRVSACELTTSKRLGA